MEIKLTHVGFLIRKRLLQWLMRAFVFLCCFAVFGFTPDGALSQNVTIKEDKLATVDEVFDLIMAQTDFTFVYQVDMFKNTPKVQLKKGIIQVDKLLKQSLSNTSVDMEVKDKTIVIKQKPSDQQATIKPQGIQVSGKVTDENGAPIPGVSVLVKGTTRGTATDFDGSYSITVPNPENVLVFSALSFATQEITVGNQGIINVMLKESISQLDEVTLNAGYYKTTQRTKTGSITKIESKEIENNPLTNPILALQGLVTGLQILPSSGVAGTAPKVQIRGNNSLRFDGSYPLYVVDGVVIDSAPLKSGNLVFFSGGIDPLSSIDPDNIKSIEILKDADATAIYGSRGANGVILITTKTPELNREKGINVDIDFYGGIADVAEKVDVLNTQQYIEMRNEAFDNSGQTPGVFDFDVNGVWDTNRNTDWQKKLIGRTKSITDLRLNINGGNHQTYFSLGSSYYQETSVFPGNFGFKRNSFDVNIRHSSKDEKFKLNFTSNYGLTKNNLFNASSLVSSALTLAPNAPELYDSEGNINWEITENGGSMISTFNNPIAATLKTHEIDTKNLIANCVLNYELLDNLNINTSFGYTFTYSDENYKDPIAAKSPLDQATSRGRSFFGENQRTSWIVEPQINYDKKVNYHNFNILVGSTIQQYNNSWNLIEGGGYTSDALLNSLLAANSITFQADEESEYKYLALYSRLGYDFKDKYFINLTGRRDGSSRFGSGNKYGNFGAIGLAWVFSKENLFKDSDVISFGKIRGSFGTTGNDQIGDYKFYNLYNINFFNYQNINTLSPSALFNNNFQWEVTKKLELALELSLFQNRIFIESSWYRNRSSNQLIDYRLPATTGFNSIFKNFDALIQNSGWEFNLNLKNIQNNNFKWSTTFNITFPENKLVRFDGIEDTPYANIYKVGEPLSVQKRYKWLGVDPDTGIHQIEDVDGNGFINFEDQVFTKTYDQKYYGGIFNNIAYKNFEFSFLLQFSNNLGSGIWTNIPGTRLVNQPIAAIDRWQNAGDDTDVAMYTTNFLQGNNYTLQVLNSNYNIVDASFLRLKRFSISYNLPSNLIKKFRIQNARIFVQGNNIYTWTKYVGFDPETGGINLPQLRTITTGINLKF